MNKKGGGGGTRRVCDEMKGWKWMERSEVEKIDRDR